MKTIYATLKDLEADAKKSAKEVIVEKTKVIVFGVQLGDCAYYKVTKKGWVQL